jgi:hypothetical protein
VAKQDCSAPRVLARMGLASASALQAVLQGAYVDMNRAMLCGCVGNPN